MNQNNKSSHQEASNFVHFLDYKLFFGDLSVLNLDHPLVIDTLNPHSFCVAEKDPIFKKALQDADILLPDGVGVVLANNMFNKQKINKISGSDLFNQLNYAVHTSSNKSHKKIFFLGSTQTTLQKIKERFSNEFPDIVTTYYSPPFKNEFSNEDNALMLQEIKNFKPHILFVGMTAPKQEKWVFANKEFIDAKIVCSIGAVFDFYAGTVKRPKIFWIDLGLEWFARLIKEPGRLWRRNLISSPRFIFKVLQYRIKEFFS